MLSYLSDALNHLPVFEEILREHVKKNPSKNTSKREKKLKKQKLETKMMNLNGFNGKR